MASKIPFKNFATELKPILSGFDISNELDNMSSSLVLASSQIKDVIGLDLWALMLNHYNSLNYLNPAYTELNLFVEFCQNALANFGTFYHMPFFAVRVSNSGITRTETANEKSAYKYQVDDITSRLIQDAWLHMNSLIEFLNDAPIDDNILDVYSDSNLVLSGEQTIDGVLTNGSLVAAFNQIDKTENGIYLSDAGAWSRSGLYNSDAQLRGVEFLIEFGTNYKGLRMKNTNTDVIDFGTTEITFDEYIKPYDIWIKSENYQLSKNGLFASYKEFDRYFSIDKSAYFFMQLRYIIDEIIQDEISPRVSELETIKTELQAGTLTAPHQSLLAKINRYLAYKCISIALFRFDFHSLPKNLRVDIDNEMRKSAKPNEKMAKENLHYAIDQKAQKYLIDLEDFIDKTKEKSSPTHSTNYIVDETPYSETEKFIAVL